MGASGGGLTDREELHYRETRQLGKKPDQLIAQKNTGPGDEARARTPQGRRIPAARSSDLLRGGRHRFAGLRLDDEDDAAIGLGAWLIALGLRIHLTGLTISDRLDRDAAHASL